MPTINQLSAVDQINDGDQFPLYSPNAGDARKASFTTVKESLAGDFASLADLAAQTGAGLVGTSDGTTVQQALDSKPTATLDTDGTLAANSDGRVASQKATKTYVDAKSSALAASGGSALVGFLQSGTGATARTVQAKLRDAVSVKDFGAVGDGVTDDTAAIQAAFDSGKSIYIPDGDYLVGDLSGTSDRQTIQGSGNYKSILRRKSGATNILTHSGRFISFEGITFRGRPGESNTNIILTGDDWKLINCNSDTTTGLVLDATNPGAFHIFGGVYNSAGTTTARIGSPTASTSSLYGRVTDIVCTTSGAPILFYGCLTFSIWGGQIGGVSSLNGSGGASAGGLTFYGTRCLGDITVDGANNLFSGLKMGNRTITFNAGTSACWWSQNQDSGCTFVNNGNANNVIIRQTSTGTLYTFNFGPSDTASRTQVDFDYSSGIVYAPYKVYVKYDSVNGNELTLKNSTNGDGLRLFRNTSGNATIYNYQGFLNFGTDAGGGNLTFVTGGTGRFNISSSTGHFVPNADGVYNFGGASNRLNTIYAVTGTINTSDARDKHDIQPLSEKEKSVGIALRNLIKSYKWNDGPNKTFVGVIAQDVIAAFEQEGLDASDYGIIDDSGERLGVRYDQVFAFIIGALC